jgi:tRNA 2-thiocytidine biosynthesis protein TtcA
MFFGGRLKAMPPKLLSEDRRHIVIRPLAYVAERAIVRYAVAREFPIIPCTLCGSQTNMQRLVVKNMLRDWELKFPGRIEAIFSSIRNVAASQLADPALFDFAALERLRGVLPMTEADELALEEELEPRDTPLPRDMQPVREAQLARDTQLAQETPWAAIHED